VKKLSKSAINKIGPLDIELRRACGNWIEASPASVSLKSQAKLLPLEGKTHPHLRRMAENARGRDRESQEGQVKKLGLFVQERTARARVREHVKTARYFLKHHDFNQAIERLTWALQQQAYADGIAVLRKEGKP